jgi:DNA-binding IclR family transcriptional regulator
MKRTNIYLEEEQLRLLKHIAVEEDLSFTELVRKALQQFLESYEERPTSDNDLWGHRLERLLERVRQRSHGFASEEIEADVTAASEEVHGARTNDPRSR